MICCDPVVYNRIMSKPSAVMDTSFWTAAVHTGVDAYLPLYFAMPILVPTAVKDEVERHGVGGARLREDQQRFRLWLEDQRLECVDPVRPYGMYGRGEAACLGVAQERRLVFLVNERRAYTEANRLGIRAVTVPEIVVRLVRDGRIAPKKGYTMLDVLADSTSDEIIETAQKAIEKGGPAV